MPTQASASPRAQAYNKVELTIQKLAGHAFMNAVRARLGGTAWSFLRRGARFAHNHRKAQGPDDPNLRTGTRSFLLTGTTLDASTVLGYCGQLGWVATADGKASAQRDLARPVLYLHPSEESSSQLVLDLRALKLYSARAVTLCMDPHMVSALVAGTALHRPRGHFLGPLPADYATRLRALLAPSPDPWLTTLTHDPVGGLPMQAIAAEDGLRVPRARAMEGEGAVRWWDGVDPRRLGREPDRSHRGDPGEEPETRRRLFIRRGGGDRGARRRRCVKHRTGGLRPEEAELALKPVLCREELGEPAHKGPEVGRRETCLRVILQANAVGRGDRPGPRGPVGGRIFADSVEREGEVLGPRHGLDDSRV